MASRVRRRRARRRPAVRGRRRRYPSDTTAAEWAILAPLLPPPACRSRTGGRPEKHDRRAVVDAIRYLVDNGCKWRALPRDFPPWQTVDGFFTRWHRAGVLGAIADNLCRRIRARRHYSPNPVAIVSDSQTVRAAETVARSSRGWLMHARCRVRDYERLPQHSEAHLTWAAITLMTRRLTRIRRKPDAPDAPR